jgi:tRNA (mo5U34)-methyltransferase
MIRSALRKIRAAVRRATAPAVPFDGFPPSPQPVPLLDALSDAELQGLNRALPWHAFTVDGRGRRFGNAGWTGKRAEPQEIPDRRIVLLHERFNLADKHVLEIGCFEGIHTVALARFARSVTAVDARAENVLKTLARCAFYGVSPRVALVNVETRPLPLELLEADIVHHVGVLYHLSDPAAHLRDLGRLARRGLWLDTHVADPGTATRTYESGGKVYRYREFIESGLQDPFSGMSAASRWLLLDDVTALLREAGFDSVEILEKREERHGPRVLVAAKRMC